MGWVRYRRGLAARPPARERVAGWPPYGCKLEGVCALHGHVNALSYFTMYWKLAKTVTYMHVAIRHNGKRDVWECGTRCSRGQAGQKDISAFS
jgi:hypothetical protein